MRHILLAAALSTATLGLALPALAGPSADTGVGVNTSATAASYSVGEAVKDSTGATVGRITDLRADATGQQAANIRLSSGHEFQAPVSSLTPGDHAAVINLTRGQIESMLSGAAGSQPGDTPSGAGTGAGAEGPQNHNSMSGPGGSGGMGGGRR